jgi:hypothetical protein
VIRDLANRSGLAQFGALQSAAAALGLELVPIGMGGRDEIERGIGEFAQTPNRQTNTRKPWRPRTSPRKARILDAAQSMTLVLCHTHMSRDTTDITTDEAKRTAIILVLGIFAAADDAVTVLIHAARGGSCASRTPLCAVARVYDFLALRERYCFR